MKKTVRFYNIWTNAKKQIHILSKTTRFATVVHNTRDFRNTNRIQKIDTAVTMSI